MGLFVALVAAAAFLLNVPLGRVRAGLPRFSARWFVAIHASIPVLVALRIWLRVGWLWVPALITSAIAGQMVGGWSARRR